MQYFVDGMSADELFVRDLVFLMFDDSWRRWSCCWFDQWRHCYFIPKRWTLCLERTLRPWHADCEWQLFSCYVLCVCPCVCLCRSVCLSDMFIMNYIHCCTTTTVSHYQWTYGLLICYYIRHSGTCLWALLWDNLSWDRSRSSEAVHSFHSSLTITLRQTSSHAMSISSMSLPTVSFQVIRGRPRLLFGHETTW